MACGKTRRSSFVSIIGLLKTLSIYEKITKTVASLKCGNYHEIDLSVVTVGRYYVCRGMEFWVSVGVELLFNTAYKNGNFWLKRPPRYVNYTVLKTV